MASARVFPTSKIPNGQWFSPCTASPGGWLRRPLVAGFDWSCLCSYLFWALLADQEVRTWRGEYCNGVVRGEGKSASTRTFRVRVSQHMFWCTSSRARDRRPVSSSLPNLPTTYIYLSTLLSYLLPTSLAAAAVP